MKKIFHPYALIVLTWSTMLLSGCAENFSALNDDGIHIDSIAPNTGYAGSTFRIYGRGFAAVRDSNHVFINGVKANVIDPNGLGVLIVSVPSAASTGAVSIKAFQQSAIGPVFTIGSIPQIDNVVQVTAASGDLTHQVFNLLITGDHFSIDTKRVKLYYSGVAVPILAAGNNDSGKPQLAASLPAYNEDNPVAIVIQSDGIKSLPFVYTTKPQLTDWNFYNKYDGTYTYITLYGSYFGFDEKGNEIVVKDNGVRIFPETKIDKWSTGEIYVILKLALGRYYDVSVKVNGIESSAINFQP